MNQDKIPDSTSIDNLQDPAYAYLQDKLFSKNVDIIIGSHPHVLQKMIYVPKSESQDKLNESFIVYSLGNYVSNQRDRRKDGGCMVKLTLQKYEQEVVD